MPTSGARHQRRGLVLGAAVLLLTLMEVAVPLARNTWIYRDGRFYVNVNENLLESASLEDPFAHSWYSGDLGWNYDLPVGFSNIARGRNGEYHHFRPWLMPVLSTPLYWAFGLLGVLLFNLLAFGVAAFGAERFAREYAPASASSLAALGLVLVGGVRARAYDYSVDVLLLALFALALAMIVTRRGLVAGLLVGACVLLKPPTILLVIPAAMILWERRDKHTFVRAIMGGAISLGIGAAMNTWMFGRPWWFGYNRVLIVEQGEQTLANSAEAFNTPWDVGLIDMWGGEWGVARRWGAFAISLIGFAAMVKKHARYVVSSLVVFGVLFAAFSLYPWRYDRYLFGAFVLFVPGLAVGLQVLARGALALLARVRRRLRPSALMAAVLAVAAALASFGTSGAPAERMGRAPYVLGAQAFGEHASLDLDTIGLSAADLNGESAVASRSRFGQRIARAPAPAVVIGGVAFAIGGPLGMMLLHLILGAILVYCAARLAARVVRPGLAAVVAVGVSLVPPLSDAMIVGGPELYAAALVALGFALAARRRWIVAAVLLGLAGWFADAVFLGVLVPVGWAWREAAASGKRKHAIRVSIAAAGAVATHALGALLVVGRPFASPHDFVLAGGYDTPVEVAMPSLAAVWQYAWATPGPARALLPLFFVAPVGLVVAWRRDRWLASVVGAGLLSAVVPSAFTDGPGWSVLAALILALSAALALGGLRALVDGAAERVTPRIAMGLGVGALVVLLVAGLVRRGAVRAEPLRLASPYGVRTAEVTLGDVPCDFLAWELMSWECAILDGDDRHRTGLRLPGGATAPGRDAPMLLVPTSQRRPRAPRTVAWTLRATDAFVLRYGAADGPYDAAASLTVRIDGEARDTLAVARGQAVQEVRYDTSGLEGEVRVELEIRMSGPGRAAAVAVDGGFEAAP